MELAIEVVLLCLWCHWQFDIDMLALCRSHAMQTRRFFPSTKALGLRVESFGCFGSIILPFAFTLPLSKLVNASARSFGPLITGQTSKSSARRIKRRWCADRSLCDDPTGLNSDPWVNHAHQVSPYRSQSSSQLWKRYTKVGCMWCNLTKQTALLSGMHNLPNNAICPLTAHADIQHSMILNDERLCLYTQSSAPRPCHHVMICAQYDDCYLKQCACRNIPWFLIWLQTCYIGHMMWPYVMVRLTE